MEGAVRGGGETGDSCRQLRRGVDFSALLALCTHKLLARRALDLRRRAKDVESSQQIVKEVEVAFVTENDQPLFPVASLRKLVERFPGARDIDRCELDLVRPAGLLEGGPLEGAKPVLFHAAVVHRGGGVDGEGTVDEHDSVVPEALEQVSRRHV